LGLTVVGGLLTSQLLTLYITPVIYLSLENARRSLLKERHPLPTVRSPASQPAE